MSGFIVHDALREIRAMIISAFASPPLPLMVVRDSTQSDDVVSSHDIIACAMQSSNQHYSSSEEVQRVVIQKALLDAYNASVDELYVEYCLVKDVPRDRNMVIDKVYDVMQTYVRKVIASYMLSKGGLPDARFLPLDSVCISDITCVKAKEHLIANRIICESSLVTAEELRYLQYREVIETFFVLYCKDAFVDGVPSSAVVDVPRSTVIDDTVDDTVSAPLSVEKECIELD